VAGFCEYGNEPAGSGTVALEVHKGSASPCEMRLTV
jgi:hypothetical protein